MAAFSGLVDTSRARSNPLSPGTAEDHSTSGNWVFALAAQFPPRHRGAVFVVSLLIVAILVAVALRSYVDYHQSRSTDERLWGSFTEDDLIRDCLEGGLSAGEIKEILRARGEERCHLVRTTGPGAAASVETKHAQPTQVRPPNVEKALPVELRSPSASLGREIEAADLALRDLRREREQIERDIARLRLEHSTLARSFQEREVAALREEHLAQVCAQVRQVVEVVARLREVPSSHESPSEKPSVARDVPDYERTHPYKDQRSDAKAELHGALTQWASERGYRLTRFSSGKGPKGVLPRATARGGYEAFYYPVNGESARFLVRKWVDEESRQVFYSVE